MEAGQYKFGRVPMASGKQVHLEEGICASTTFQVVHILVSIYTKGVHWQQAYQQN